MSKIILSIFKWEFKISFRNPLIRIQIKSHGTFSIWKEKSSIDWLTEIEFNRKIINFLKMSNSNHEFSTKIYILFTDLMIFQKIMKKVPFLYNNNRNWFDQFELPVKFSYEIYECDLRLTKYVIKCWRLPRPNSMLSQMNRRWKNHYNFHLINSVFDKFVTKILNELSCFRFCLFRLGFMG